MDKLSVAEQRILDTIDEEIEKLEVKLAKAQPLINRLNKLRQTRRTLLSEKGTTSGAGRNGAQVTQEQVIEYLRKNGASQPAAIAEALGVKQTTMRSHLNRNLNTTYERDGEGNWDYIGRDGDEDEEDDE